MKKLSAISRSALSSRANLLVSVLTADELKAGCSS